MATNTINGDLRVNGDFTSTTMTLPSASVGNAQVKVGAEIARSKLALDSNQKYVVPLTDFRVWDAMNTVLPGTSSNDDLALVGGTLGTSSPTIQTGDVKNTTVTRYARALVALPPEYEDGETVTIRLHAGMITTVASSSATVDVECYKSDKESGVGSDLCSTAAQDINSLTFDDMDFTITPTGLVAGDLLDVRIAIAVSDSATVTAVIGAIGSVELLADVRG